MEIVLLSIACIMNAAAIIIHLVSHIRGNRRKGFGASYADIKQALRMQRFLDDSRKSADSLRDAVLKHYGVSSGDDVPSDPE